MHSGNFKKSVTVISNAKNNGSLPLYLSGTIRAEIAVSTTFLHFPASVAGKKDSTLEVVLSTEKKDFAITEVVFKPTDNSQGGGGPAWQKELPIFVKYTMKKSDTVRTDGYFDYKLRLSVNYNGKESKNGQIIIKTNNLKKREITISSMIDAVKQ